MPRVARLDAPLMLHHVIGRGIERRSIFVSDDDRFDFVDRLAAVVAAEHLAVYAWALMPNHFHLLIQTGNLALSSTMQIVLGGYASAFNRRHRRAGHLFQNRFKSTLVQQDPYLIELVRYIHLNPLRARLLTGLTALDGYAWTGHAALLGRRRCPWQSVGFVLAYFGTSARDAAQHYRAFVAAGVAQNTLDLDGSGVRQRSGCFEAVSALARGREAWTFHDRILGDSSFVQAVLTYVNRYEPAPHRWPEPSAWIGQLIRRLSVRSGLEISELTTNTKRRRVVRVRQAVCYLALCHGRIPASRVAPLLGVDPRTVLKAAAHGEHALADLGCSPSELLAVHSALDA